MKVVALHSIVNALVQL